MKDILSAVETTFGAVGAAVVLVFLAVSSVVSFLLRINEAVANARARKEAYEAETRRLQLIKLFYEIEAIKKTNALSVPIPVEYEIHALKTRRPPHNNEIVVRPALRPRRLIDALGIIPGFIMLTVVLLPGIFIAWLLHNVYAGLFVATILDFAVLSIVVRHLAVSDAGIRFVRLVGSPRFLPWESIKSIEPVVNPMEVFTLGSLWPLFPPREATASMTLIGHYKITWTDGFRYFPPRDPEAFEALVRKHLGTSETRSI